MYSIAIFQNNAEFVNSIINNWETTETRDKMIVAKKYYDGNNVTIQEAVKEIYLKNKSGQYEARANPYVSNYKISNKFVQDMIDQKVYTLLDKSPLVAGVSQTTEKTLKNRLDFALQEMGVEASLCGYSFAYIEQGEEFNYKVFETQNCIGFIDDITSELKALIRYWSNQDLFDRNKTTYYAEVYDNTGITLYQKINNGEYTQASFTAYRTTTIGNAYKDEQVPLNWDTGFPVVELKNNKQRKSDFDRSIRSQVDALDIVNSNYANNLTDFAEIIGVVKQSSNGMEASTEELGNFLEELKAMKAVQLPEGMDYSQMTTDIPYQAKVEFCNQIKKQLSMNAGTLDTEMIFTGGLTATAINVASQRLNLRVSKFEYFVYMTALRLVKFAMEYAKDSSSEEITINFKKGGVKNDTEIIQNILSSSGIISQKTMLEHHPYVDNVDEELAQLDKEGINKFSVEGGVDDGFSTQQNGITT